MIFLKLVLPFGFFKLASHVVVSMCPHFCINNNLLNKEVVLCQIRARSSYAFLFLEFVQMLVLTMNYQLVYQPLLLKSVLFIITTHSM